MAGPPDRPETARDREALARLLDAAPENAAPSPADPARDAPDWAWALALFVAGAVALGGAGLSANLVDALTDAPEAPAAPRAEAPASLGVSG